MPIPVMEGETRVTQGLRDALLSTPYLMMETPAIADDFHSHKFLPLVIETLQDLAERPFAEHRFHFIAVAQVVIKNHFVIAFIIIKPMIVWCPCVCFDFISRVPLAKRPLDCASRANRGWRTLP